MTSTTVGENAVQAHRQAVVSDVSDVVRDLDALLGSRLVAYIGGVKETRAVRQWAAGERTPSSATRSRLRAALIVARTLEYREARPVIQAWFQGMNPHLDDRSPARVLREAEGDTDEVMSAARTFAQHG